MNANVFITSTPQGRKTTLGLSLNALDDDNSQRTGGSSLPAIIANVGVSVLRFPGDELADKYIYFKSPYTDPATHTLTDTLPFPGNVPAYFSGGVLNSNVVNINGANVIATGAGARLLLTVSCSPTNETSRAELANVAAGLVSYCDANKIPVYGFELSNPNASDISNAMRAVNANVVLFTKGYGNVVANGFWSVCPPLSNIQPAISAAPGNYFGNLITNPVNLVGNLLNENNNVLMKNGPFENYVITNALDPSPTGWTNLNDWGRGLITAEIIGAQSRHADLVIWSSTRATARPGGNFGNSVYSCFTNTNGYTPVGRAVQLCGQIMKSCDGWSPVITDTPYIGATVFMDAYTFGLRNSGPLGIILTNKSNTDYNITVHHGMTRPNATIMSRQLTPVALNNTTTAAITFSSGGVNVFNGLTTGMISNAYSLSGTILNTYKKITSSPILTLGVDALNKTSPYGAWNTATIIAGKPSSLSGYRDMKLSTFTVFTDPGTKTASNVVNCFYKQYSGGKGNTATGGFNIASNANVFPRGNLAVFCDLFYDENFDWGISGKTGIGLFCGQESAAGGNFKVNSSSARCVFKSNGTSSLYVYTPARLPQRYPTMTTAAFAQVGYGTEYFEFDSYRATGNLGAPQDGNIQSSHHGTLRKGSWNNIGIGIKVNTFTEGVPNYDGECFMSVNGVARELRGVRWLANTGHRYDNVSQMVLNTFFGGDWTSPVDCNCYYSNVSFYDYNVINELKRI